MFRIYPQRGVEIFGRAREDAKAGELVRVRVESVEEKFSAERHYHYAWAGLPSSKYDHIERFGAIATHYTPYRPVSAVQNYLDVSEIEVTRMIFTLRHQHDNPHALIVCDDVIVGVLP